MARRKREPMSEGKKNIIAELIEEYDIRYHRPPSSADRGLKRPLGEVYLIVFIDAVHFSVRENGQIKNLQHM